MNYLQYKQNVRIFHIYQEKFSFRSIKVKKKNINSIINEKKEKDNIYGIKLLNSSVQFLTTEEKSEKPQKKRKIKATIDEKTNFSKCKIVAVDPERILSKIDTEAWTSKRKEPEFNYKKLKNGTLVEKTQLQVRFNLT